MCKVHALSESINKIVLIQQCVMETFEDEDEDEGEDEDEDSDEDEDEDEHKDHHKNINLKI